MESVAWPVVTCELYDESPPWAMSPSPSTPEILISETDIQRRVDELAAAISSDYAGADDLIMVGVLRGAFIFLADLSRRLTVSRKVDFIAVSTYGNAVEARGAVRLVMDLRVNIVGQIGRASWRERG